MKKFDAGTFVTPIGGPAVVMTVVSYDPSTDHYLCGWRVGRRPLEEPIPASQLREMPPEEAKPYRYG